MRVFHLPVIFGLTVLPLLSSPQSWPAAPQSAPYGSYLGVQLVDIDANRANMLKLADARGVEVKAVEQGSPADGAGLDPGDILLSYNGENILGMRQLARLVQETPPQREVKIQFLRAGKTGVAVVTTATPPSSDVSGRVQGYSLAEGPLFPRAATIVPRPLLVWRDLLLGIEFEELDPPLSDYFGVSGGVLIRAVEKDSPAEKAGLKAGDVVVAVSSKSVANAHDFASCLRKPGAAESVLLVRNHKKLNLAIPSAAQ